MIDTKISFLDSCNALSHLLRTMIYHYIQVYCVLIYIYNALKSLTDIFIAG